MIKKWPLLFLFGPNLLWACPYCTGTSGNANDANSTIVIFTFIILTYIPFYLIFRKIWQHRSPKNPSQK